MPRNRGAANERSEARRVRGEHDNQKKATSASTRERRTREHAVADHTTDSLQLFINQAMKYPLLTKEEEVELAQAIERGDLAAKERLINSNLRLVIKFARRYQGHGLDIGDLVQEAMLGLIRAAEKFDWRRGYKFSTYAVLLDQAVDPARARQHRPAGADPCAHRAARAHGQPCDRRAGDPDGPPAHRRGGSEGDGAAARRGDGDSRSHAGHHQPRPDGRRGDTTLGELLAESTADLEEEVLERQQEQTVEEALAKLPENERRIIIARFGTGGREARSSRGRPRGRGHPGRGPRARGPRPPPALRPTSRSPAGAARRKTTRSGSSAASSAIAPGATLAAITAPQTADQ